MDDRDQCTAQSINRTAPFWSTEFPSHGWWGHVLGFKTEVLSSEGGHFPGVQEQIQDVPSVPGEWHI